MFALGLVAPLLLTVLLEAEIEGIGDDWDGFLGPAYAVQTLWIFAIIVAVAAMNSLRFDRVSLVATVKSEAFAAFVGARFCVGIVFLTVQLLP